VQQVKEYAKRRHTTNGGCIKQGEQVHYNRKKKLILTDICQCPILSQQQNYVQYKPYSQDSEIQSSADDSEAILHIPHETQC
jgi:hypothetical protein